jgi:O-antigen ligase
MTRWDPDASASSGAALVVVALAFALLGAGVVGGGAPWSLGDVIAVTLALPACAALAWARRRREWPAATRVDALLAICFLVLAASLVPLPPGLWEALPGRAGIAADLASAGVPRSWHAHTLDPDAGRRALLALLPGGIFFAIARQSGERVLLAVVWLLLVLGLVSVLLGLAQVASGPESALRLHAFHNRVGALGIFSYRNAHASFLLLLVPLAFAEALAPFPGRQAASRRLLAMVLLPVFVLGLALTFSRAALALGVVALGACAALAMSLRPPRAWGGRRLVGIVILGGFAIAAHFALPGFAERQSEGLFDASRLALYAEVLQSARDYWPAGAGLGAFEQAFQPAPRNVALVGAYTNHAHNDWLELIVDLGLPGVLLAAAGLLAFAVATARAWRQPRVGPAPAGLALARAASVSILLALLHATFDYTLRSGANLMAFCACAAMLAGFIGRPRRGAVATG